MKWKWYKHILFCFILVWKKLTNMIFPQNLIPNKERSRCCKILNRQYTHNPESYFTRDIFISESKQFLTYIFIKLKQFTKLNVCETDDFLEYYYFKCYIVCNLAWKSTNEEGNIFRKQNDFTNHEYWQKLKKT